MTDVDLIQFATEFREGVLDGRDSFLMCAMVSWPLAGLLRFHGIEAECVDTDLGECNHVWIRLADGRALDATADQFNRFFPDRYPPVYLGPPMDLHGVGEATVFAGELIDEPVCDTGRTAPL